MRWSIIRLIWLRELRDQLRDRRTIFMIAVLPVLLYPLVGFGVMSLFVSFLTQKNIVGLAGSDQLLPWRATPPRITPQGVASWFVVGPTLPGVPVGGIERIVAGCALELAQPRPDLAVSATSWLVWTPAPPGANGLERFAGTLALSLVQPRLDYPPLIEEDEGRLTFCSRYHEKGGLLSPLVIRPFDTPVPDSTDSETLATPYRGWLEDRKIDLLLVVPPRLQERLHAGEQPTIFIYSREKDETSRLVNIRVSGILGRWRKDLKEVRLVRAGLPGDFDTPFHIHDPEKAKSISRQEEEGLFAVLVRVFPFVLVMWSLAGALYPAVDLCAGEKERGTMETLLISPVSREEIVFGKFLTIWLFSAATALLNLVSMAVTTWQLSAARPGASFRPDALFWGVALLLPLSAFFSALCLAVGAYARSSKEGQYYLMPLFLVTMPLIFLTLAPGVELNPFYSMVPVTGVALLLQKLVGEGANRGVWLYFIPVLAPIVVYSWLALRWAIEQFQREEVLFREAERLDIGLWLKRLMRDKEALPSAGEALFCFALILGLRWMSFGIGQNLSLLTRTGISQLAFVATPPLFMALLLTNRPIRGMGIRKPVWWSWPAALILAVLVVPPLAELTVMILRQFPALKILMELNHPLTRELRSLSDEKSGSSLRWFVVLAVLPALCEELAFRGFILQGLLRGFRPWRAILLSAFLFALYQMNVFQFLPHFVFGVILGLIVVRSGSVLPAILFHLVYNVLVIAPAVLPGVRTFLAQLGPSSDNLFEPTVLRLAFSTICALIACATLVVIWRRDRKPTAQESIVS
jgi:sodium transport system permease protein